MTAPQRLRRGFIPLDDREQQLSLWAGGLGAALSVAVLVVAGAADKAPAVGLAASGLVVGGLMAFAARRRSRMGAAMAALYLSFGPLAPVPYLSAPYLGVSGWLFFRGARQQWAADAEARRAAAAADPPARGRRRKDAEPDTGAPAGRKAPTASKRYTPPQGKR
ncbi:MAG TPA: hypothetical protein VFJ85_15570 [Acidimicrobiales bacterium]|nr:hypothetical protein [Acidimicrobiales bacterium]